MFSQSFVTLSVLLVMSGISLKAHEVKSQRFAGSYSSEESGAKMAEEGMERLLAIRILDGSQGHGTLLTDGLPVEKGKQSPDPSPIKHEDPTVVRSLGEVTYWPRRTFPFPFQYPFDLQRRREMLLSRRNSKGTRFSLSLDVPTNILSILIDLAKAKDMRAKAAANAELMARIGK
ncbi:urocortin 3, like [Heterodontus francisci]|uniref:urocortin 3, like n=1 Tax=Heterodontus francisci TaxID=7792 RepID=UPI00355B6484